MKALRLTLELSLLALPTLVMLACTVESPNIDVTPSASEDETEAVNGSSTSGSETAGHTDIDTPSQSSTSETSASTSSPDAELDVTSLDTSDTGGDTPNTTPDTSQASMDSLCTTIDCGAHGTCSAGVCECDPEYSGKACKACSDGYELAETGDCTLVPPVEEDSSGGGGGGGGGSSTKDTCEDRVSLATTESQIGSNDLLSNDYPTFSSLYAAEKGKVGVVYFSAEIDPDDSLTLSITLVSPDGNEFDVKPMFRPLVHKGNSHVLNLKPIEVFNGESIQGDWTLLLRETDGTKIPTITSWSMDIIPECTHDSSLYDCTGELSFEDKTVERAVRAAAEKTTGVLFQADVATITELDIEDKETVGSLRGIECLSGLSQLYMGGNAIVSLDPVQANSELIRIWLNDNLVRDLSPLKSLEELDDLRAQRNKLSDMSALQSLTGLSIATLSDNYELGCASPEMQWFQLESQENANFISDCVTSCDTSAAIKDTNLLTAVALAAGQDATDTTSLTNDDFLQLTTLQADSANIEKLNGLECLQNLEELSLSDNVIEDLGPLQGLTKLKTLNLSDNKIKNLSPLIRLRNLTDLRLFRNEVTDIRVLAGMPDMKLVILADNDISNIAHVRGMKSLGHLSATQNRIFDISPVSGLTKLKILTMELNQVRDISPLNGLTSIEYLHISDNQFSDTSPLATLSGLDDLLMKGNHKIDCTANEIGDLRARLGVSFESDCRDCSAPILIDDEDINKAVIAQLPDDDDGEISAIEAQTIKTIEVTGINVVDLGGMECFPNLEELALWGNPSLEDLTPLAQAKSLRVLDLHGAAVTSFRPLVGASKLEELDSSHNDFGSSTYLDPLLELEKLRILDITKNDSACSSLARTYIEERIGAAGGSFTSGC